MSGEDNETGAHEEKPGDEKSEIEAEHEGGFVAATELKSRVRHPFSEAGDLHNRGNSSSKPTSGPAQGRTALETDEHKLPPEDDAVLGSQRQSETGEAGGPSSWVEGKTGREVEANTGKAAGQIPAKEDESHLPIGCGPLDILLQGGIETDAITLVFGEAGSGKTNLALQLAMNAALRGKRIAYVDTEGVSAMRMEQIFANHPEVHEQLLFFTPYDIEEQERLVRNATMAPDLGLVVVDSINMHYRLHIDGNEAMQKQANRSLVQQLHLLTTFARQHQVPVLVTGQVYGFEDSTQPFARRTMEHLVKALVRFHKSSSGGRVATILKHRSIAEGEQARFRIAESGLVDD